MTYASKLTDPRWQKKRLEILQRDDFRCQLCQDKEATLHVHHKSYKRNTEPWDYPDDNFVTYCEACHAAVEVLKEEKEFMSVLSCEKFSKGMTSMCFVVYKKTEDRFLFAIIAFYKDDKTTRKYFDIPEHILVNGSEAIEKAKTKKHG